MTLSATDIRKLCDLSRLEISEDHIPQMLFDLEKVVRYVSKLEAVDVTDVEPMTHAIPMDLRRRTDEVLPSVGRAGLMGSAEYEDGLVKVPKIIE